MHVKKKLEHSQRPNLTFYFFLLDYPIVFFNYLKKLQSIHVTLIIRISSFF